MHISLWSALVFLLTAFASSAETPSDSLGAKLTTFIAREIITMDPDLPRAEAVVVMDGK